MSKIKSSSIILFLLLSFCSSLASDHSSPLGEVNPYHFVSELPASWQRQPENSAGTLWLLKDSPTHASIAITPPSHDPNEETKEADAKAITQFLGQSDLKKSIEKMRSDELSIVGITKWTLDKTAVSDTPQGKLLEMQGHYKSAGGRLVHFTERDFFVGSSSYSISFFEDVKGATHQSASEIKKLLDLYQFSQAGK